MLEDTYIVFESPFKTKSQMRGILETEISDLPSGAVVPLGFTPIVPKMNLYHSGDFHFRLHINPAILQLINPTLNSNIPFYVWNTADSTQQVIDLVIPDSEVLSFDFNIGDTIESLEYRTVNMQIDSGEPSIDTEVQFYLSDIMGVMKVLASISETFNLIPDVPVREEWEFKTDILTNYKGDEQRISLMPTPQVTQDFEVEIIDLRQRREQYALLAKNIAVQTVIAFYQYGTHLTADAASGTNRFYFETNRSNVRVGEFLLLVNSTTEQFVMGKIEEIYADGVRLNSAAPFDLPSSENWIAIPCFMCLVEDGSGITMNNVTGRLRVKAKTFQDPELTRPFATRTFQTIDDIPIIDRRPIIPAAEDFAYRKEVWDNDLGVRMVNSRDPHPSVYGNRKFIVQRNGDPEEMDFWRSLFNYTRGAQKSFLLPTYFPDLIRANPNAILAGESTFELTDGELSGVFLRHPTWSYVRFEYPDMSESFHRISNHSATPTGTLMITVEPAVPADRGEPTVISYMPRVRASDRIVWEHYADYSEVSFGITTTDT